ncbi:hypothetical protein [Janibacter sp. G1551]|uniref:hypothetical protein n=1 Tax=Janibacter sp. G1551 TaxID=3420440 RepID=UPI003D085125
MDHTKKSPATHRDPVTLAPSVDRSWVEAFILEQRLLDVPGDRIGDALVTVETHVAESGERADDVFGDPRTYARDLAATVPASTPGSNSGRGGIGVRTIAAAFLGLVGLLLTNTAFEGWLSGTAVSLSWGHLAAFALTLLLLAVVVGWISGALRVLTTSVWLTGLVIALFVAASVALMVRLPGAALEGPAATFAAVGLLSLAAGAVLTWRDHTDDPVLAPGERPSGGVRGRLLGALTMPLATAFVLGLTWVLHLLA